MIVGVLSDVHGNLSALRQCLNILAKHGAQRIICLGDVFGYLPLGLECRCLLEQNSAQLLLGNHEALMLGLLPLDPVRDEQYGLTREALRLPGDMRARILASRPWAELEADGLRYLLVHGSPWDPLSGYLYPDADWSPLAKLGYDGLFMGHTHHATLRREDGVTLVNVGSCGLPRDNGRQGCLALLDTQTATVELLRFEIDVAALLRDNPSMPQTVQDVLLRPCRAKVLGG